MPDITVRREIMAEGKLKTWSMSLTPRLLIFTASSLALDVRQISFPMPETNATKAFEKFLQWSDTAAKNETEPFTQRLTPDCTAEITARGGSVICYSKILRKSDRFDRADIEKFCNLLKQFSEAKSELDQRVEKANREADLFK